MNVLVEWGLVGARSLLDRARVFVVVDVLSFSTCVDVACANGATIVPWPHGDRDEAVLEARRLGAELAGRRSDPGARYCLSPATLTRIPRGTRLVLPSPNGSSLSTALAGRIVLTACLRNAAAVARAAAALAGNGTIAVIAAGERWPDGSLRPAVEDLLGAGALVSELGGTHAPEAQAMHDAFLAARPHLVERLAGSTSGLELVGTGFAQDVEIAARLNVSACAPLLVDGAYAATDGDAPC